MSENRGVEGGDAEEPGPSLADAYALETPDDARDLYARWADTYEDGFISSTEYVYHLSVARVFVDHAGPHVGVVLDVGCGTGLVGCELRVLEDEVVDGVDISPEMLVQAGSKVTAAGHRAYRELVEADLLGALPFPSGSYAGMVSAGTFTHGHVGPAALDELLRIAAPGCRFALGVNREGYAAEGFEARFAAESRSGAITGLELADIAIYDAIEGEHADARALIALFSKAS